MKQSAQQDLRYRPLYSLREVGRYARVKPATLRSWTHNGDSSVIIPADVSGVAPFSFINLIELYVLEGLRRTHRLPMQRIRKGQGGFPEVLARYLQRIARDAGKIPKRFYPYTYDRAPKIIVMDPAVAYGRPVVAGTRVTSQMIFDRYSGGESLNDIAADYDLDISRIEEALRCEIERIAA